MSTPDQLARLTRLELQVSHLYAHLGLDPSEPIGAVPAGVGFDAQPVAGRLPAPGAPGGAVPPELLNALQAGKLIEAIKIYRSMTGLGLAESKAAVEEMARQFR